MKTIYLAGGCFWGVQKFFDQFDGVIATETGYANGPDRAPTYRDVCMSSGHAETVRIDYDEEVISLARLLEYYFLVIDPLSVNRQGNDRGIQYRTGIYYTDADQLPEIEAVYSEVEEEAGKTVKHFRNVGIVFLRHLCHKRRRLQVRLFFRLVHPLDERLPVDVEQLAEPCRVEWAKIVFPDGLARDHHQVVNGLVEDQQLAVAVIHLATGGILRDESQGVVVGQLFVALVHDL